MKKLLSLLLCITLLINCVIAAFASGGDINEVFMQEENEPLLTVNLSADIDVNAKSYVLMDINTGTLLASNNENEKLYPASVTKIMTLLLVCEAINAGKLSFDETLLCSDTAARKGGSQIWLEQGEEMTVRDLLKAAAVYSANDACCLLGEAISGSEAAFVNLMNERASELGMSNTHFDNCTGLDDDTETHLTTAHDIALMARELMKIDYITEYTTIWMDELRDGKTQLVNTNRLIRFYSGATGLKTGTTSKAGCCIAATAEREGLGLIAVVLGASNSNDRFNGARNLLDYGFANYEIYSPNVDLTDCGEVKVLHGVERSVSLYVDGVKDILLSRGVSSSITQEIEITEETEAPVTAGQTLGALNLFSGDVKIAEYELKAETEIKKLTFFSALKWIFGSLKK